MKDAKVLDIACGVGYGSQMIATQTDCAHVVAVDNSKDAVAYAAKYYNAPNIDYRVADCLSIILEPDSFDIIICFETIEHIANARQLLETLYRAVKPRGRLLCSAPNQEIIPFSLDTHPFHLRHYTPEEFIKILEATGFDVKQLWSQSSHLSSKIIKGTDGVCTIAVCMKND